MKIGILGGGQLARMLALAGYPLGLQFVVLDPSADACAAQVASLIQADYDDENALKQLADEVDLVTFEFENVPAASLAFLKDNCPVYPPPAALQIAQDRLQEKNMFCKLNIPVPEFRDVQSKHDLQQAVAEIGLPAVLKTRSMGYDGKGQIVLKSSEDIEPAWQTLGGQLLILEAMVAFDREVSIIGARNRQGDTVFYPLSENLHHQGILHCARCLGSDDLQVLAEGYIKSIFSEMDYVGVLALELFVVNGQLLANEIAPRVHNSGHWTIEGAQISQFENHLRAVIDWPLGNTDPVEFAAMVNFIGAMPEARDIIQLTDVHLHHYHKAPRPGRKIGHATVRKRSSEDLAEAVDTLLRIAPVVKD
ncbi:MAG: 5-(carboxyamino)imidazole ribonucleotide synthase [Gammaproteobacteria bacterium]|nr:5-(carboxyamino)imidazole ribonucleotide synthase [Gammaproteobacteria bacterium]